MARTQGQIPLTFFKPIFGKNFDTLMYIPPNVAPLISELNGRKTYLNDSSGRKWEVSVSEVDGLLAFQQGWNDFFTGHDLENGDFVVFLYTGTYFNVEFYDKSVTQRFKFQNSSQTKKRTQMDRQSSNPLNDFIDLTNISSMKNKKSRKRNMVKESDEQGKKSRARPLHSRNDKSQSSNPLNDLVDLTNIRLMKKEKSRQINMETDEQGKKCSARRLNTRNDKSQLKRDAVYREKRKSPRYQDQSQSNRYSTKTNGDTESPPSYLSRIDRSDSERNAFEETLTHFHSQEDQPQFKRETNVDRESPSLYRGSKDRSQSERNTVEIDDFEEATQFERQNVETDGGDRENPSLNRNSKDGSESGRNSVDIDDFEETSQFKRQDDETDVGDRENSSPSCIKKAEIQPKREFFEDSFFGFAWEEVENTNNEVRTAVLDLSEFEVWGGCCTNQSAGIKAAAFKSGFGDKEQGTSSCDVRTNETSNCSSEVAAKVEAAGEMFGYKSKSDAPTATKKEKGHILFGDHPREPTSVPVSGAAVPIKKERMGADALPLNLAKNKPTAQGAALPVIKREGMQTGAAVPVIKKEGIGADAFRFNLTKNNPTAQEKPTISAKTEPKIETFTGWSLEPLRAVATNLSFLELPLELPGESETLQCSGVTQRVVFLQDSFKRLHSVIYNSDTTRKVLSRGWDKFCKANGIQLGDECIFHFRCKQVYDVSVVKKQST